MAKIIILIFALIFPSQLWATKILSYAELQLKDYDEIRSVVDEHINKSDTLRTSKNPDRAQLATEELREALFYILSRPNRDNMISKFFPTLHAKLRTLNSYEDTLLSIAKEASHAIENGKQKPRKRASYIFILTNMMSELQPQLKQNPELKQVFEAIAQANIKIPMDIQKNLRLNMYPKLISPSEVAKNILEKLTSTKKK